MARLRQSAAECARECATAARRAMLACLRAPTAFYAAVEADSARRYAQSAGHHQHRARRDREQANAAYDEASTHAGDARDFAMMAAAALRPPSSHAGERACGRCFATAFHYHDHARADMLSPSRQWLARDSAARVERAAKLARWICEQEKPFATTAMLEATYQAEYLAQQLATLTT